MAKSPVVLSPAPEPANKKKPQLLNNICFIVDRSGSMGWLRDDLVRVFNLQAQEIRQKALESGQNTRVSLVTFNHEVDAPVFFDEDVSSLGVLRREAYLPEGGTALFDALGDTLKQLQCLPRANDKDASFLVIVLTDGEERDSRRWQRFMLGQYINGLNATDRYSIVFLVPPSYKVDLAKDLYIPAGNIRKWNATQEGFKEAAADTSAGMSNYFHQRSTGVRSVKSFFTPDLSGVTRDQLRQELQNVTSQYQTFKVTKVNDIRSFIEEMTDKTYIPGHAFYQLTKKEEVQAYKSFLVRDGSGRIYEGNDEARALMGLPVGGSIILYPGAHKAFEVFVQSTSVNRKLIPNTEVLYKK